MKVSNGPQTAAREPNRGSSAVLRQVWCTGIVLLFGIQKKLDLYLGSV